VASLCFTSVRAARAKATKCDAEKAMGKPIDHLAKVGDLVVLDEDPAHRPGDLPGLVLKIDTGWAHVEWYDTQPNAKRFGEDKWSQWHPHRVLSIISEG